MFLIGGEVAGAEDCFQRAIAADPGYYLAHHGLGMIYARSEPSAGGPPDGSGQPCAACQWTRPGRMKTWAPPAGLQIWVRKLPVVPVR